MWWSKFGNAVLGHVCLRMTVDISCSGTVAHPSKWVYTQKYLVRYLVMVKVPWQQSTFSSTYPSGCSMAQFHYPPPYLQISWTAKAGIGTLISYNPSFCQKHPGIPDGSDGSDRTSHPLTENYTLPVPKVVGRVACSPPLLCAWNVVTYMHHQNATCITLFPGAAVMV